MHKEKEFLKFIILKKKNPNIIKLTKHLFLFSLTGSSVLFCKNTHAYCKTNYVCNTEDFKKGVKIALDPTT